MLDYHAQLRRIDNPTEDDEDLLDALSGVLKSALLIIRLFQSQQTRELLNEYVVLPSVPTREPALRVD
jgi:hypothetical protein